MSLHTCVIRYVTLATDGVILNSDILQYCSKEARVILFSMLMFRECIALVGESHENKAKKPTKKGFCSLPQCKDKRLVMDDLNTRKDKHYPKNSNRLVMLLDVPGMFPGQPNL